MELRLYQKNAVDAVYNHLRNKDNNPCVVIPTGGGKTPVLATIIRDAIKLWNGRVLVLTHVKELLLQAEDKLRIIAGDIDIGIYSAGLNRREPHKQCVLAGIQSAYKIAKTLGHFDLVIVDEAHLIPPDGTGMYQRLLGDLKEINPLLRVIGLTATPYRTTSGMICTEENILNEICYEISVRSLIESHFLSPLCTQVAENEVETDGLKVKNGEFDAEAAEKAMCEGDNVKNACEEILHKTRDRNSVLVFCAGISHANSVLGKLKKAGAKAEAIFGDTLSTFRESYIREFKNGQIKYLVNVGVLTTGFDAPNIDCVAMLRPTCSPGLYYQMVGRGLRLHKSKKDCLVLDFAGNAMRHGPIDTLAPDGKPELDGEKPARKCPVCLTVVAPRTKQCPKCGYIWEPPARTEKPAHDSYSNPDAPILSGKKDRCEYPVKFVRYVKHTKRNDPTSPPTVRIEYHVNVFTHFCEWICPEHDGYAHKKFKQWWREHATHPESELPVDVDDAIFLAQEGALKEPGFITVETEVGKKYPKIVGYQYPEGNLPKVMEDDEDYDDEVPF